MTNGSLAGDDTPAGVLICDDYDAIRKLLGAIVANEPGLRVVGEAADGNEVIVEAIALQPDVILLDLAMPKRSGVEALPELRHVAPDARIVVLSGFTSANVAEEVIALGANELRRKGRRSRCDRTSARASEPDQAGGLDVERKGRASRWRTLAVEPGARAATRAGLNSLDRKRWRCEGSKRVARAGRSLRRRGLRPSLITTAGQVGSIRGADVG